MYKRYLLMPRLQALLVNLMEQIYRYLELTLSLPQGKVRRPFISVLSSVVLLMHVLQLLCNVF